jgi:hypothetical protein
MSAVPTYAGPSCRTCCDLRPNPQFARSDGTWEDYSAQPGKTVLALGIFIPTVQKTAEHCANCAMLLEAVEKVEGKSINGIDIDDEFLSIFGKLGEPLELDYNLDGVLQTNEVFSALGAPSSLLLASSANLTASLPSRRLRLDRRGERSRD